MGEARRKRLTLVAAPTIISREQLQREARVKAIVAEQGKLMEDYCSAVPNGLGSAEGSIAAIRAQAIMDKVADLEHEKQSLLAVDGGADPTMVAELRNRGMLVVRH